jgi:hypothetical protein
MTYLFKLARRTAAQRALPLIALTATLAACNTDQLGPNSQGAEAPTTVESAPAATAIATPSFSATSSGIPYGMWRLPTNEYGSVFNVAMRNIAPTDLLSELAAIKNRGGKIVLMFAGKERNYIGKDGHFSLTMWKERVDRYKSVNFDSYVADGTIIAHYLIDEPNDPHNWGGVPVSGATVEAMAAYSKAIWPKMQTVVRVDPGYLVETGGPYRNLDIAWAQYVMRKGSPTDYIQQNVADAQKIGLQLITGMNITRGGSNGGEMTASQIVANGTAILANSYPCAFLNYFWYEPYVSRADIHSALVTLSQKADAHVARSCGGSTGGTTPPPPPPPPTPLPGVKGIVLTATKAIINHDVVVTLKWAGAAGTKVDFYRNGDYRRTIPNDGLGKAYPKRVGTYSYKICEAGKSRCSNTASVTLK